MFKDISILCHENVLTLLHHLCVSTIQDSSFWIVILLYLLLLSLIGTCLFICLQHDKAKVVQTVLFVTGINTILQTLFGTRLPTVIGGSYAFVIPVISVISDPSLMRIADDHTVSMQLSANQYITSHLNTTTNIVSLIAEVQNDNESHTGGPDNILLHSNNNWLQPVVGCMLQVQTSPSS